MSETHSQSARAFSTTFCRCRATNFGLRRFWGAESEPPIQHTAPSPSHLGCRKLENYTAEIALSLQLDVNRVNTVPAKYFTLKDA